MFEQLVIIVVNADVNDKVNEWGAQCLLNELTTVKKKIKLSHSECRCTRDTTTSTLLQFTDNEILWNCKQTTHENYVGASMLCLCCATHLTTSTST